MTRTVARVRPQAAHADVMFYESPRIYRLPTAHPHYAALVQRLQAAAASGATVEVQVDPVDDGAIADVSG